MADTFVSITAGTGTNIDTFTEATNGNHRQCVVLGDPSTTAGVAAVSAANGLAVDVTRVVPGVAAASLGKAEDSPHADGDTGVLFLGVRNHFTGSTTDGDYSAVSVSSYGDLHTVSRRDLIRLSQAVPGVTTATTTYATGDQMGTLITFTGASRATGSGGTIVGVQIIDPSDVIGACDVLFFDSAPTLGLDNAAFTMAARTDYLKLIGVVTAGGAGDYGNGRLAQVFNLALPFVLSGSTSLYAAIITRTANAVFAQNATAAVTLNVFIERN